MSSIIQNETNSVNRDFKGIWIPREIWLHPELTIYEKTLWAEIHSLYDREKGGCYATNDYLMRFLGVKERRLQQIMAFLKEKNLLVQVSFNGRSRVVKAIIPPEDFGPCGAEVQYIAPLGCTKVRGRDAQKCTPPIIYDNKEENKEENSSKVLKKEEPAKAGETENKKPTRAKPDFSTKVREVGTQLVNSLTRIKPDYIPPKNLTAFLTEIDFLLRLDKRDPQKVFDVFNWALADSFWADKMFKPNPAKYLREKFDQLEMKMNAKPEQAKKERKFAPCSNDERAREIMKDMEKRAL